MTQIDDLTARLEAMIDEEGHSGGGERRGKTKRRVSYNGSAPASDAAVGEVPDQLPPKLAHLLDERATPDMDRSARAAHVAKVCLELGLDDSVSLACLLAYEPEQEKFKARADRSAEDDARILLGRFRPLHDHVGHRCDEVGCPNLPHWQQREAARPKQSVAEERTWPVLDTAAHYGLVHEVITELKPHTEADVACMYATFLSQFGASVGRGPQVRVGKDEHPAKLYTLVVGNSAHARKRGTWTSPFQVMEVADKPLFWDRTLGGFGSGEAVIDAVAEGADQRLIVDAPEFASILRVAARSGSTLSALFRQGWDAPRIAVRSRSKTSVANDAYLVVHGEITEDELKAELTTTDVANGFVNRFLILCAKSSKMLPEGGNLDDSVIHHLAKKTRERLEMARRVGVMHRSPEARELWDELYREMGNTHTGGLLGSITGRDQAQVLRLQVAYALTDASRTIEVGHVKAAMAVWSYARDSAAYIFGDTVGDVVADRLLAAIRQAGPDGLSFEEQSAVFGRHESAERLKVARELLGRLGRIITELGDERGGRRPMVSRVKVDGGK